MATYGNGFALDAPAQVYLIADYGDKLAAGEVGIRIRNLARRRASEGVVPWVEVTDVHVSAFNTIETGFVAYQLALTYGQTRADVERLGGRALETYFYINTAPREDKREARRDNDGERLVYARLNSGIQVVGVLAGYSFSFLEPLIVELREIRVESAGSQFRSRDIFPQELARLVRNDLSRLGRGIDTAALPSPPKGVVVFWDGYGNGKIFLDDAALKELRPGDKVRIDIGGKRLTATYTNGIFNVKHGELVLAPGSSGTQQNPFLEVVRRHGHARNDFNSPRVGEVVSIDRPRFALRQRSKVA